MNERASARERLHLEKRVPPTIFMHRIKSKRVRGRKQNGEMKKLSFAPKKGRNCREENGVHERFQVNMKKCYQYHGNHPAKKRAIR